jgi:hypothetical protein
MYSCDFKDLLVKHDFRKRNKQRCLLHEPDISYLVEKDDFDQKRNFQNSLKRKRKHSCSTILWEH